MTSEVASHGRATGLALAALGLAACLGALAIGEGWGAESWGPRTVPLLAGAALLAAGLADAASGAAPGAASEAASGARAPVDRDAASDGNPRLVWALLGTFVLYALLMARTGYVVSTAAASVAAFALFGARRPAVLVAVGVLCPLGLHLVFFSLLGAFPPRGTWFDVLDWLPS